MGEDSPLEWPVFERRLREAANERLAAALLRDIPARKFVRSGRCKPFGVVRSKWLKYLRDQSEGPDRT